MSNASVSSSLYSAFSSVISSLYDRASAVARHGSSFAIRKTVSLVQVLSYPFIKTLFCLVAILLLTNIMYIILKVLFAPVGFINEEVYFDYLSEGGPAANLTLVNIDKQWNYLLFEQQDQQEDFCRPVLGRNTEYDISMMFTLAKSAKNFEIGSCMVYLTVLNCHGQRIASSVRSLRLPYQSRYRLSIDTLLKLPIYLLNIGHESENVRVDMMRRFREVNDAQQATYSLQVALSKEGALMDIERSHISIEPRPTGISYLLYAFPFSSFFALNTLFLTIFVASTILLYLMGYTLQGSSSASSTATDNVDDIGSESSDDSADNDNELSQVWEGDDGSHPTIRRRSGILT